MTVFGGDIIYARDINDLQWVTVRPAADLTRASTVTPTDDPEMQFEVEANTAYEVQFDIYYSGLDAADFKCNWTVPSGTTGVRWVLGPASNAAANADANDINMRAGSHGFATVIGYGCSRNGTNQQHFAEGAIVNVGATAGSLVFQWAQVTTNATGSTRHATSYVKYRKLPS